jgi:hypothetical protein
LPLVQTAGGLRASDEILGTRDQKRRPRRAAFYHHAHWTRANAPLLDELGAAIDHIEAHSTGGLDSEQNLAAACKQMQWAKK